ncbi:MAG: TrmO family methyltransferase, partial [Chloroflexota bacterium]
DPQRPLRGVFATRSQYRPNGVGATVARIVEVAGNILTVTGLDAQDGSPVLDIKPYSSSFDATLP